MCCCQCENERPKRGGIFSAIVKLLLLYAVLVIGGGTLINTGHPVAVEVGQILHLVTFVEPASHWAHAQGFEPLAATIDFLAAGLPIG